MFIIKRLKLLLKQILQFAISNFPFGDICFMKIPSENEYLVENWCLLQFTLSVTYSIRLVKQFFFHFKRDTKVVASMYN